MAIIPQEAIKYANANVPKTATIASLVLGTC